MRPNRSVGRALLLFALMLINVRGYSHTGNILITILAPTGGLVSGTPIFVQAKVQSTYQINTVVANVEGNQTALSYDPVSQSYTGNLSLSGLTTEAKTLTVTATDVNSSNSSSVAITYHVPPVLNVLQPYNYSTARPYLPVKVTCFDSLGACSINISISSRGQSYSETFTNAVDTVLDLSAFPMSSGLYLGIQAKNALNQVTYTTRNVFIETSPYLKEVYADSNQIADFSDKRVFVVGDGPFSSPRIVRLADSSWTSVPYKGRVDPAGVHLTTQGAVFYGRDSAHATVGYGSIFDWNSGTLDSLGQVINTASYIARGGYCAYNPTSSGLYLRDLSTKSDQLIGASAGNGFDLTENGTLAFISSGPGYDTVVRYQNGTRQAVADYDASLSNSSPVTDGRRIVYLRHSSLNQGYSIWLFDGTGATQLGSSFTPTLGTNLLPGSSYQVSRGWVAYANPGSANQIQLWTRDSTGVSQQATFYSGSSSLDLLNPKGEMIFSLAGNVSRNFYSSGAIINNVCTVFGTLRYQDSSWYFLQGRTLFRINLNPQPNKPDSFTLTVRKDSLRYLTLTDFSSHFEGDGILMAIQIMGLPHNGSLKLGAAPVTQNQIIARTDVNKLVYVPNTGFTGTDTIQWNGSNSVNYSSSAGIVVLQTDSTPALTAPTKPLISGLASSYCILAAAQKIRITNIPDHSAGVTVSASIDGQPVAVASDSTVVIAPGSLGVGRHGLQISFVNSIAGDTSLFVFAVDSAVTPLVRISASASSVTISSQPVVLTASEISGGGMAPLYTFSRDRGFATVIQAEGNRSSMSVDVSTLLSGKNMFYVRMSTSDTCYLSPSGVDSVAVFREDALPPSPQVNGLRSEYCSNADAGTIAIVNMPAAADSIVVTVQLDGRVLTIVGDGRLPIQPGSLPAGAHVLMVVFSDRAGADTTKLNFNIDPIVVPVVKLIGSTQTASGSSPLVTLTAMPISGGGPDPLYTFSKNGAFTDLLRNEGESNTITLDGSVLSTGNNIVYVRMKTSDTCYSSVYATDSITILRLPAGGGLIDPDFPDVTIAAGPNPFAGRITITGLQTSKSYRAGIVDRNGQEMMSQHIQGQQESVLVTGQLSNGLYFLRLYDEKSGRLIGTVKLLFSARL
ncbi:MAG TPA: T9SS type A sorting domain-containing protein [Puia sp.]|jgi:hypothetical protein|nr:T9SS type A sorting domain-containing protein [Puia sp.]